MIRDFLFSSILYLISLIMVAIYTLFVANIGHKFWPENSSGSLIYDHNNNIRGSMLLVQKISSDKYFKGRAINQTENSCNIALYNEEFKKLLLEKYNQYDKDDISFITPSSSLLDPYITVAQALKQAPSVALARNVSLEQVTSLIQAMLLKKSVPFFELEIVNTTLLNSKLDLMDSGNDNL